MEILTPWEAGFAGLFAGIVCWRLAGNLARRPAPVWVLSCLAPLLIVIAYSIAVRRPDLGLRPLLSWVLVGRWRFLVLVSSASALGGALYHRLPKPRDRRALALFAAVVVAQASLGPTVSAALARPWLAAQPTLIDRNGVCRQTTDFTCGPAAAVTALRSLGVNANEGELAVWAGCSQTTGTPPDILAQVIDQRFRAVGVTATLRRFDVAENLNQPKGAAAVALLNYDWLLDHWVCVYGADRRWVLIGDPDPKRGGGLIQMPRAEFDRHWRRVGIIVQRSPVEKMAGAPATAG